MNTKRLRFQLYIETTLGCYDIEDWGSYKAKLEGHVLSADQANTSMLCLRDDAADLYYKAILSLCKGLNSLFRGYHSWPVVNLYYSSFYSMRAHLAALGTGIVKNRGIYRWTATSGTSPEKVDVKGVRGDHQATLAAFRKVVRRDVLETNTVEGIGTYNWLMEQRNSVQYRDRVFSEPDPQYFHANIFDVAKFRTQVEQYILDRIPVYCFDPDHCMLAAPIRRLMDTRAQLKDQQLPNPVQNGLQPLARLIREIDADPKSPLNELLDY